MLPKKHFIIFSSSLLLGITLCGCGGGGGTSGGTPGGNAGSLRVGDAKITFSGKPKTFTSTYGNNGLTVAGFAGASVTQLTLQPAQTIANTSIVYTAYTSANSGQIWTYTNGVFAQITHGVDSCINARFTPTGQIGFTYVDPVSGLAQIAVCNYDGSGFKQITTTKVQHNNVTWAPNNSKIAFNDNAYGLYTVNTNGTGETKIGNGIMPAWSPDSKSLLAEVAVAGGDQIFSMSATGANPALLTTKFAKQNCSSPTWSPDGKIIAFDVLIPGTSGNVIVEMNSSVTSDTMILPGGFGTDFSPSFSPDSNYLTFVRGTNIMIASVNGDNPGQIYTEPALGLNSPCWSNYLTPRTFIGTSGSMYATAAGFLMSRLNNNFASLVAFQARTPSTATCTAPASGGSGGELVYDLHADLVTGVSVSTGYYIPAVTYTAGTGDVLVYINSQTGQVDLVAPFAVRANSHAPSVHQGGKIVTTAAFTAVYDAKGTNLAPGGASEIAVDETSGKVVSIR